MMDSAYDRYLRDFPKYPRLPGAWQARPFQIRYQDLHLRTLSGPYRTPLHLHLHYELILVVAGDYRCMVDGQPYRVRDHGAVLVLPGEQHEECGVDWVRYQALAFACIPGPTPERSWNLLNDQADPAVRRLPDRVNELLAGTARLIELGSCPDSWTPVLQDTVTEELVLRMLRMLPAKALREELQEATSSVGFASDLRRVFATHPGALGVAEIAATLGMSARTLTARCHAQLGASPAKLHTQFRMEQARTMVMNATSSLAEIAAHLGFADQFHFSKVYKRVHGMSPLVHRRQVKE